MQIEQYLDRRNISQTAERRSVRSILVTVDLARKKNDNGISLTTA